MNILAIRTDSEEAYVGLYDEAAKEVTSRKWTAKRELSDTILDKIDDVLSDKKLVWSDLDGVVHFSGPGSFTGLRIGGVVASTIVSATNSGLASVGGEKWVEDGIERLKEEPANKMIELNYGGQANITKPRK